MVNEVTEFCYEARVDGVIISLSNDDGLPDLICLDVLKEELDRLQQMIEQLKEAELIVYLEVKPEWGHTYIKCGNASGFAFQNQVNLVGETASASVCPLDTSFLEYINQLYTQLAQCGADIIWVNDKLHFTAPDLSGTTCFCDEHLETMSNWTNTNNKQWLHYKLQVALSSKADQLQNANKTTWHWGFKTMSRLLAQVKPGFGMVYIFTPNCLLALTILMLY